MRKAFDCRNEKYACLKSFQTGIIVNNRAVFLRLRYNGAASHQRPLQNPHLWRISALCAARSLAYLLDMSALAALLRLELHPHLRVLQRSQCLSEKI